MKILAYDTSGSTLSVGVFKDQKCLSEKTSDAGVRHSEALVPIIEEVLKKSSVKGLELDVLAVCLGPGSFTGLRVGVSTAKMLALVWGVKMVGVSFLEALAFEVLAEKNGAHLPAGKQVAVSMDARKSKLYAAVYASQKGNLKPTLPPSLTDEDKFLAKSKGAFLVKGDGIAPNASRIARAAWPHVLGKKFIDPSELEPLYLHPRDCNVTLKK